MCHQIIIWQHQRGAIQFISCCCFNITLQLMSAESLESFTAYFHHVSTITAINIVKVLLHSHTRMWRLFQMSEGLRRNNCRWWWKKIKTLQSIQLEKEDKYVSAIGRDTNKLEAGKVVRKFFGWGLNTELITWYTISRPRSIKLWVLNGRLHLISTLKGLCSFSCPSVSDHSALSIAVITWDPHISSSSHDPWAVTLLNILPMVRHLCVCTFAIAISNC